MDENSLLAIGIPALMATAGTAILALWKRDITKSDKREAELLERIKGKNAHILKLELKIDDLTDKLLVIELGEDSDEEVAVV